MILTATGAWFTDSDSVDITPSDTQFGVIDINLEETTEGAWDATAVTNGYVMPGSVFEAKVTLTVASCEAVELTAFSADYVISINGVEYAVEDFADVAGITVTYDLDGLVAGAELAKDAVKVVTLKIAFDKELLGNDVTLRDTVVHLNSKDLANPTPIEISMTVSATAQQTSYVETEL